MDTPWWLGMLKQQWWGESWWVRSEMQHAVVELSARRIGPAKKSSGEKMIQLEQKGAAPTCMQLTPLCAVGW